MFLNLKQSDTSPISTGIADPIVAGANVASNSTFPTKLVELVHIVPNMQAMVRYFLTKSPTGIVSLHCMAPFQRISTRVNANQRSVINTTNIFIGINCNKNEYDTKEAGIHVISESNLAMSELAFNCERTYNGVVAIGSAVDNYIPYNVAEWTKPLEYKGEPSTVGAVANKVVLDTFFKLKKLMADLQNKDLDLNPDEVKSQMEVVWNKLQANEQVLIQKGILVLSTLMYADSNAFTPVTAPFANTTSQNKYLDHKHLFGSMQAGASFPPVISLVMLSGIITPTEAEPVSGYSYGQYDVASKKGEVVVVSEANKPDTLETTTREVSVYDSSGRACAFQMTVNDIRRNENIIKRSSNFMQLPTGTAVKAVGKLIVRVKQPNCLAVNFRVSVEDWTTEGRSNSNEVNTVLSTYADTTFGNDDDEDAFALLQNVETTHLQPTTAEDETQSEQSSELETQQPSQDPSDISQF